MRFSVAPHQWQLMPRSDSRRLRLRWYSGDWCALPIASASFGLALCLLFIECHVGFVSVVFVCCYVIVMVIQDRVMMLTHGMPHSVTLLI